MKKYVLGMVFLMSWSVAGAMNIASYATPSADSALEGAQFAIENLIDGSLDTYWASTDATSEHWYQLMWAYEVSIEAVTVDFVYPTVPSGTWARTWKDFNIKVLKPGATDPSNPENWIILVSVTDNSSTPYIYTLPTTVETRGLKVEILSNYGYPYATAYELSVEGNIAQENIAAYATPSADSALEGTQFAIANLIDGSLDTYWASTDATSEHWYQLIWSGEASINQIKIDFVYPTVPSGTWARTWKDFIIKVMKPDATDPSDPANWTILVSVTDNSSTPYIYTLPATVVTRGLKVEILSNYGFPYAMAYELSVLGEIGIENIASYATPSADSALEGAQFAIVNLIDGSLGTYWASTDATSDHWYRLMWGGEASINQIKIDFVYPTTPDGTWARTWKNFDIKVLNPGATDPSDPTNWTILVSVTDNGSAPYIYTLPTPVQTKGLQIDIFSNYGFPYAMAYELSVEGVLMTPPYHTLSTLGSNRGTSYPWINKMVSLTNGNVRKTHVVWLDNQNQDTTPGNGGPTDVMYSHYDDSNSTWSAAIRLGTGADNHGGSAIASDSQGRLHVVYGPHEGIFKYRYTPTPGNYTQWSTEVTFGQGYGTYPSLVIDANDTLHLTCRDNLGAGAPKLVYYRKPGGGSWSTGTVLVDSQKPSNTYIQYANALAIDGLGRLHLAYNIEAEEYGPTYPSQYVYYMRSDDGGTTWRTANGTPLTLPVTSTTGEVVMEDTFTMYPNTPGIAVQNIVTDANNRPWIVASIGSPRSSYLCNFDGTYWNMVELLPVLQRYYPGGYTHYDTVASITEGGDLYLFTSFNPQGVPTWGNYPLQTGLLRASVSDVATNGQNAVFEWMKISNLDATRPGWNCSIERNVGHNLVNGAPSLLYQVGAWDAVNTEIRYVDSTLISPSAAPMLPGDANGDGVVDVGDLGILAANYGGSGKTWAEGDFNDDGVVDVGDLGILAANYGTGSSSAVDFDADYAEVFGETEVEDESASSLCTSLGLPLIAGLALIGLMLVKLED